MGQAALSFLAWMAALLCVIGIGYGVSSSRLSVSFTKGSHRLRAYVYLGAGICVGALSVIIAQARLPSYEVTGTIETAHVRTTGKSHRTNLTLVLADGTEVVLDASDTSPYFRLGQQLSVRYKGRSNLIVKAHFFTPSGIEEGQFNGSDSFPPYWFFLTGLIIIWAGFVKNKRDPESAEQPSRNQTPYGSVDKLSLIKLSGRVRKIRRKS